MDEVSRYVAKRSDDADMSGGVATLLDEPDVESPVVEAGLGAEREPKKRGLSSPEPVAFEDDGRGTVERANASGDDENEGGVDVALVPNKEALLKGGREKLSSSLAVGGVGGLLTPPNWVAVGIEDEEETSLS